MTKLYIALRNRVQTAGDLGQGSLEYIGAILVAAAIVAVVLAAVTGATGSIGTAFNNAVTAITGG